MSTWPAVRAVAAGEENAAGTLAHVAVVHGPSDVYFVVVGDSREEMLRRLAARLDREAHIQLWREDAERFKDLVTSGRIEEAVDSYFATVGGRWDPARLSVHVVRR